MTNVLTELKNKKLYLLVELDSIQDVLERTIQTKFDLKARLYSVNDDIAEEEDKLWLM